MRLILGIRTLSTPITTLSNRKDHNMSKKIMKMALKYGDGKAFASDYVTESRALRSGDAEPEGWVIVTKGEYNALIKGNSDRQRDYERSKPSPPPKVDKYLKAIKTNIDKNIELEARIKALEDA